MGQILEKSVKIFFGSIPVYPPNFQEIISTNMGVKLLPLDLHYLRSQT